MTEELLDHLGRDPRLERPSGPSVAEVVRPRPAEPGGLRDPVSHLSLDIAEAIVGWLAFFAERGIEVAPDDLGRPSVERHVLGELLSEDRQREAQLAARRAEQEAARKAPIPAGVPALDDASPYESMVAAGEVTTPAQEFGGGRRPVFTEFLEQEFAQGQVGRDK